MIAFLPAGIGAGDAADPAQRKVDRPPALWEHYMHGVVDDFAAPLAPDFGPGDRVADRIENPFGAVPVEAFAVKDGILRSRPLELDLAKLRGKKVRYFYWMRGLGVGRDPTPNSYHDAPQCYAVFRGPANRVLSRIISHNGGVGDYPWRCYYLDVQVPPDTEKASIEIESLHGPARFARFSWELIDEGNTYTQDEKQDPATGSIAANPNYSPINFHFIAKPPAGRHPWNFLKGPDAGLVGQPYNLTTFDGLRRYFAEAIATDLDQMNHGVMYFPSRFAFAREKDVLPPLEGGYDGYMAELSRLVLALQDPETGYWGTRGIPKSMSVTFHFLDMLFAFGIDRPDKPAKPDPRRLLSDTMPNAEAMVRTTLRLQSRTPDGQDLAAWSQAAYNWTDDPQASKNRCALGTTMNAIRLLRLCRRFVSPKLQREIDVSIDSAFRYALEKNILPNGLWRQQQTDRDPSKAAYWANIVDFSYWMEWRTDPGFAPPAVARDGDAVRVAAWPARQNSVRFYRLSDPAQPRTPREVAAVVSRGESHPKEMDPYRAVRVMAAAAAKNWGVKTFGGFQSYVYDRVFRQLPKDVPFVAGDRPVVPMAPAPARKTPKAAGAGTKLYAVAVDADGVESPPVAVE